jgi:DNA-binding NarL/FixJ family response regulator
MSYPFNYDQELAASNAATVIKHTAAEEWNIIICDISMTSRGGPDVMHALENDLI